LDGLAGNADVHGYATTEQYREVAELMQMIMESKSNVTQATMQMLGTQSLLQAKIHQVSLVR
jgi:hypothetical protein